MSYTTPRPVQDRVDMSLNRGRMALSIAPSDAATACRVTSTSLRKLAEILKRISVALYQLGVDLDDAQVAKVYELVRTGGNDLYDDIDDVRLELGQLLSHLGLFIEPEGWFEDNPDLVGPTKQRLIREGTIGADKVPGLADRYAAQMPNSPATGYTDEEWAEMQARVEADDARAIADGDARAEEWGRLKGQFRQYVAEASPCQRCGTTGTCNCTAWAGGPDTDRTD